MVSSLWECAPRIAAEIDRIAFMTSRHCNDFRTDVNLDRILFIFNSPIFSLAILIRFAFVACSVTIKSDKIVKPREESKDK
jgi:hypothetical protein